MRDIPKMYHNNERKVFNNNKRVFTSYCDNQISIKSVDEVRKKINSYINSNDFIYRKKLKLVIDNQVIEKKVVGIVGNNIITIDNEYIPIEKIKDVYK